MKRIIIWGLKSVSHSHRYIHEGFFNALSQSGNDCVWVDDEPHNNEFVTRDCLVISVNLASKHLTYRSDAKFVLHNVEAEIFQNQSNVLNLQVLTNRSTGNAVDDSLAKYDVKTSTIYQPWGIPTAPSTWLGPNQAPGRTEYWVGSIWNNDMNQGNTEAIAAYKTSLESFDLKFEPANKMKIGWPAKLGGKGLWTPSKISESEAAGFVSRSPIGAAIVGNWQRENGYVPCRLFKNLAAGQPATSNADFSAVLDGASIFSEDMNDLILRRLNLSARDNKRLVEEGQRATLKYTYERGFRRMLACL